KVMLVTMNMQTIAQMSCNPAMGGVAKGQIVREIDALGGYSGIVTDETAIQFRMLNRSKGPAMWSPRAQSDRLLFAKLWREKLEQTPGVDFWQDTVVGLLVKDGQVEGVRTGMGMEIRGKAVVLTNGTFLNGLIHVGMKQFGGGRMAEKPASGITEQLVELGFESGRMKTGTPPRVDGRSLDYSKMEEQPGDVNPGKFSYTDTKPLQLQRSCHVTYTSQEVHDALRKGFDESPMFSGRIKGPGPRYCPSIEDKIDRFASKDRHQIFVEPEGWNTVEVYVNGFSTSLPEQVQFEALRKIAGFENVRMFRPGYAIEYDYFPPVQLTHSLETRLVRNLFFAGQINGTTGYEEAACQGLMAGINAHQSVHDLPPFEISRSEGYIGVLIDDLINKGTEEPYRMFTSRAEFRVLLRQDNADLRLTEKSHTLGLADIGRLHQVIEKRAQTSAITDLLQKLSVAPDQVNGLLEELGSAPLKQKMKATSIISRPHVGIKDLATVIPDLKTALAAFSEEYLEQAEIEIKYEGYVAKEQEIAEKMQRLEDVSLSESLDYHKLQSLSSEAREKLSRVRPRTLGQASRISGVSPADISVLMVYMGR
ncbi:MAG TPA: tRNA uridine-5-carboxymethylaminomethyl(34) synthesis enzyme MnmG, partial [Chitinophagales bacterium]|nr:tRNA uridine-5-carboxymethylaminomethyl(34) synthesis enzyme MnmG [Chitinophagales bacterium]